mmetsp:Transcript_43207/g.70227  ORF Transcript_43207/g.70227 Transcript_43207/m.70227 type:complete len:306 (-) Transcript_43207:171-1088(-)
MIKRTKSHIFVPQSVYDQRRLPLEFFSLLPLKMNTTKSGSTYRRMKRSLDAPSFTVQESTPKKHRRCTSDQFYLRNSQKRHGGSYLNSGSSNFDGHAFANGLATPRSPLKGCMSTEHSEQKGRRLTQSSNPFTISRKSGRNIRNHRARRRIDISSHSRSAQNLSKFSRPPRSKSSSSSFSQRGHSMDLDQPGDRTQTALSYSPSASYFAADFNGTDTSRSPPPSSFGRYPPWTPASPTALPMFTNQRARSRSYQNCPLLSVQSRNDMEEKSAPSTPTVTRRSYKKDFPWKFTSPKAKGFSRMAFD